MIQVLVKLIAMIKGLLRQKKILIDGLVKILYSKIKEKLEYYKREFKISKDDKLYCLLLTNESVAEFMGIKNIYDILKKVKSIKKL